MGAPSPSATLQGALGERISLAWKPRDIRQRLHTPSEQNWLTVRASIDLDCYNENWSFTDACLTEGEVAELVDFLSVRPWPTDVRLTFTEPALKFRSRGLSGDLLALFIRFSDVAAPPCYQGDPESIHNGYELGVFVTDAELHRFANQLRAMLGLSQ